MIFIGGKFCWGQRQSIQEVVSKKAQQSFPRLEFCAVYDEMKKNIMRLDRLTNPHNLIELVPVLAVGDRQVTK